MAGIEVPDSGAYHPEAAGGVAFNGPIGRGVADTVLDIIAAQPEVKAICDLGCGNGYLAGQLGSRGYTIRGCDTMGRVVPAGEPLYRGATRVRQPKWAAKIAAAWHWSFREVALGGGSRWRDHQVSTSFHSSYTV